MATTSRYSFSPARKRKFWQKVTLADRFRAWRIRRDQRRNTPDVFMVTWY